jgi:hypothetical protein
MKNWWCWIFPLWKMDGLFYVWLMIIVITINYICEYKGDRKGYIYICKHTIRVGSWDFRYGKWMKMGGLWINKNNQAWEDHRIYD